MHRLHRGNAPACLAKYRYGRDRWSDEIPTPEEKADQIWPALEAMQGNRCAYCEDAIGNGNRHIEHFRQSSRYRQGTFEWSNLFGSCNRNESCGKHKDSCDPYNHEDLIKPDEEDPEHFFLFVSDGTIQVQRTLNTQEAHRASETLRVFNLNSANGPLRHMRKRAIAGYLQTAEEIRQIAEVFPQEEWLPFLEEEISRIRELPFATAMKHSLIPCDG
jgi:uncharacterized protein (TIGR02646 family)